MGWRAVQGCPKRIDAWELNGSIFFSSFYRVGYVATLVLIRLFCELLFASSDTKPIATGGLTRQSVGSHDPRSSTRLSSHRWKRQWGCGMWGTVGSSSSSPVPACWGRRSNFVLHLPLPIVVARYNSELQPKRLWSMSTSTINGETLSSPAPEDTARF